MATSYIPTFQKIQNLEVNTKKKIEEILKQAEEDKKTLITKRTEEIIKTFTDNYSFTIDNKVLAGFLISYKKIKTTLFLKNLNNLLCK
ncbi:MAG TPA: hypothetical protein LFW20_08125 [Rickettsia endosymbiont of Omalisus fontisbellaquei]|nr:hypothetical protein [Rickettsia endosymbiont of Omalisus fontisbellaquei]